MDLEMLKTVAKGATREELAVFAHLCETYGLDPYAKEIFFLKHPRKLPNGQKTYDGVEAKYVTSRDGYLKVAQQNPEYVGPPLSFAVCEGDEFIVDAETYTVKHRFGAKRGGILGAWSKCERKGKTPSICFVPFGEYNSPTSTTWQQYPTAMIIKVAEAFTLKRQFGISGLVTQEELDVQGEANYAVIPALKPLPNPEPAPALDPPKPKPKPEPKPEPEPTPASPEPEIVAALEQAPEVTPEPVEYPIERVLLSSGKFVFSTEDAAFRGVIFSDGTPGGIVLPAENAIANNDLESLPVGKPYEVVVWEDIPANERDDLPEGAAEATIDRGPHKGVRPFVDGRLVVIGGIAPAK